MKVPDREQSNYIQRKLVLIIQTASHQVQQTVHHFKAGQTHQKTMSNKGDQEEVLEMAQTFTADLVVRAIQSCRNSKVHVDG